MKFLCCLEYFCFVPMLFTVKMSAKFVLESTCHLFSVPFICLILQSTVNLNEGSIVFSNETKVIEEFPSELVNDVSLPLFGIRGAIVNADPLDACVPISKPPNPNYRLDWFVLIDGNSCDYNTKGLHSQLAGYSVAIIYTANESSGNATSQHWDINLLIPVVMISEETYVIIQKYLYSVVNNYSALIIDDGMSKTSGLYLVFSVIILYCVYKTLKYAFCTVSNSTDPSGSSLLKQLGTSRYQMGYTYKTCVICYEDFRWLQKLRILPCSHGFHVKCIDPWLLYHQRTCPVCKQGVCLEERSESQTNETTPLLRNINPSVNNIDA